MFIKTLKGCGIGFAVMLVLLFILSFVVVYTSIPYEMSGIIAMLCMVVGMFIAGFISSVGMPGKGWMRGLLCGGIMLLVIIIFGIVLNGSAMIQPGLIKGVISAIIASSLGGILGINV